MTTAIYSHCAKGGHERDVAGPRYVCEDHRGSPGLYTHCARCGKAWDAPDRMYVCTACLQRNP